MSNELPTPPTQRCEPVYIGSSNIGERLSTKKYKQSWYVFFGYYRRGRIKRMRKRREPRYVRLDRRWGIKTYCFTTDDFLNSNITRWNRH